MEVEQPAGAGGEAKKEAKKEDKGDGLFKSDKPKVDFSADLAETLPAASAQAKAGDLTGAVDRLLALEKRTRAEGDAVATSKVAVAVVRLCQEVGDWPALNANILLLAKRRSQLKQASRCASFPASRLLLCTLLINAHFLY